MWNAALLASPDADEGARREQDHGFLIAGDTLFSGSIGRTDFPLSDPAAMSASLQRLLRLPDETKVKFSAFSSFLVEEILFRPFCSSPPCFPALVSVSLPPPPRPGGCVGVT